MTRRDFWILVLILLVGTCLTFGRKIQEGKIPFDVHLDGLEILQGDPYSFVESRESPLAPGALLQIDSNRGDVEVVGWDEPKVRIEVRKLVRSESQEEAAQLASGMSLELTPSTTGIAVKVTRSSGTDLPRDTRTDFSVSAPRNGRLVIMTGNGHVSVREIGKDVVIHTSHGDVEAQDLGGRCEVVNRQGAVTLDRVAGDVTISTLHDDVHVSEAAGAVRVESAHGSIAVRQATGPVSLRTSHGEVAVSQVRRDVRVDAPHSPITMEAVSGNVTVSAQGDPVELSDVAGAVDVSAEATSVSLVDVRGNIRVVGRHTDVQLVRPGGDVEVQTTHQGIDLALPAGRGFRLAADSDRGEIESDIPGLHLPEEPVTTFSGTVGDGRHAYHVSTSHSTIRIHTSKSSNSSRK